MNAGNKLLCKKEIERRDFLPGKSYTVLGVEPDVF
jgi:hypothetical protein